MMNNSVHVQPAFFNGVVGLEQILFSQNKNCGMHTCQHFMLQGL